jgi:hypothetical protein
MLPESVSKVVMCEFVSSENIATFRWLQSGTIATFGGLQFANFSGTGITSFSEIFLVKTEINQK